MKRRSLFTGASAALALLVMPFPASFAETSPVAKQGGAYDPSFQQLLVRVFGSRPVPPPMQYELRQRNTLLKAQGVSLPERLKSFQDYYLRVKV